ncbi:MAG: HD domain-containing protein, partial [Limnoraphis robusta]
MILSSRFRQALVYACELHADQVRKGSGVPYVAHLLGVASIALEYGANESEAIAALLPREAGLEQGRSRRIVLCYNSLSWLDNDKHDCLRNEATRNCCPVQ